MSTSKVQTWLAHFAISKLNDHYGTAIEVERVRLEWPNLVHLYKVYAPDDRGDTLFAIHECSVRVTNYSHEENALRFGMVKASNLLLRMHITPEDSLFNFARFIGLFETPKDPERPDFQMRIDQFSLKGITYDKIHSDCASCTNIRLRNANLSGKNFELLGLRIAGEIQNMTYEDLDRFDLHQFYGKAVWSPEMVIVDTLSFETDQSKVAFNGRMQTDSIPAYREFLDLVTIDGVFFHSRISSREFQSWVPQFPNFDDFLISGIVKGTVHDFEAKDVKVIVGNTFFDGDVALKNCTMPDKLFIQANARRLLSDHIDLQRYVWQFVDSPPFLDLKQLGKFQLKGDYVGTIRDFDINGKVSGEFGQIEATATLSNLNNLEQISYEGRLQLIDFNTSLLLKDSRLGPFSGSGIVKGSGLTRQSLRALVDLRGTRWRLNGYSMSNIFLNGFVEDRSFDGRLQVRDPELDMDFEGTISFQSELVEVNFFADLRHAGLPALNLIEDSVGNLKAKARFNFTQEQDQDWLGVVTVQDILFENSKKPYAFNAIKIESSVSARGKRIAVTSDLLNALVKGQFDIQDLIPTVQSTLRALYPHYGKPAPWPLVKANFDLDLKDADLLFELLTPGIKAASGTKIRFQIDVPDQRLALDLETPKIQFFKHKFEGVNLELSGPFGGLKGRQIVGGYSFGNIGIDSLEFTFTQDNSTIQYALKSMESTLGAPEFDLKGLFAFEPDGATIMQFGASVFDIVDFHFEIADGSEVRFMNRRIEVNGFRVTQDNGVIALEGIVSGNPYEVLRVRLDNMTAGIFNDILGIEALRFDGLFNGELLGSDLFSAPKFAAGLEVDSLKINNQWMGDLNLNANWNLYDNLVQLSGSAMRGDRQTMEMTGTFYPGGANRIYLDARLNRFRLAFMEPFFAGILSNIRGAINGNFVMDGPIAKPKFDGQFVLDQFSATVPYLNTAYVVQGSPSVEFTDTRIFWEDVPIREATTGTTGTLHGLVAHNRLQNFRLNIRVEADNLLALNTTASSEEYFYGRAFAKGSVDIFGPIENITIRMDATSTGNTRIHIPLNNPTEVSQQRFITFVGAENTQKADTITWAGLEGLNLDLTFNMTTDAEVFLQLDPDAGGVISGRGTGRIRLIMDESGALEMFGNYEIASGNYQFMLQRLVNKPFRVAPGSTIAWNGDPFNAQLDIRATYSTRTTLNGVVTSPSYPGNRVNVDLDLLLGGTLMETEISFEIKLPQSDPSFQEELNSRFNNADQLNEQAFSLLIYNSFFDPTGGAGGGFGNLAGTALGANAMQGLSAQFSNFLNKGTGDLFDINVAYNPGGINTAADPLLASQEEVAIDVSRQFFDDRVVVNSVFDVPVGANPNRLAGNISVEYKITPDGRIRTRFFNRSNLDNPYVDQLAPYSQGIGIFYRKDFDKFQLGETFRRIIGRREEGDTGSQD
jgi:hypothetical protein